MARRGRAMASPGAGPTEEAGGDGGAGDGRVLRHRSRVLPRPGARDCRVFTATGRTDSLHLLCDDEINASATDDGARAVAVELDVAAGESAPEAALQMAWDAASTS
uniref:Uncharacterized protein n=1 Tax=Arundo donax TaxID=35708 RepID=A0A0A9BK23_ARUDO